MATLSISLFNSENELLSAFKVFNADYTPKVIVADGRAFGLTESREIFSGETVVARYDQTSYMSINAQLPILSILLPDRDFQLVS